MGVFSYFSKEKRYERKIARQCHKMYNKYIPLKERENEIPLAISILKIAGTPEAVWGLLMRYTVVIENNTLDQAEKEAVYHALVELGDKAVPSIIKYLRDHQQVTWPSRALVEILGEELAIGELLNIYGDIDPAYDRNSERRIQLISLMGEYSDPRIADTLILALKDESEMVRFYAIETAESLGVEEKLRLPLLDLALREESIRLRNRALEVLASHHWSVVEHRKDVEAMLPPDHYVNRDGQICNRKQEIVENLQSSDPKIRKYAPRDVHLLDHPEEIVEALIESLSDEVAFVRESVVNGLIKIGDFRAMEKLKQLAKEDPDFDVQNRAKEAIRKISSRSSG